MSKAYTDAGFERVNRKTAHRIILAIDGAEKSGKTNFTMTMPDPMCIIDTDIGLEGVVEKYQADKELYAISPGVTIAELREIKDINKRVAEAQKAWDRLMKAYHKVLGTARTVVVDNATEMWELLRTARFGKLTQVMPHQYGPVNAEYRDFVRAAFSQNATNLALIHKIKDEYVNEKRTGKRVRSGFSDTAFLVQCNLSCWRDVGKDAPAFPDCFNVDIIDCRQNMEIAGVTLSGADANFPQLATMVFPDTKEGDWV